MNHWRSHKAENFDIKHQKHTNIDISMWDKKDVFGTTEACDIIFGAQAWNVFELTLINSYLS